MGGGKPGMYVLDARVMLLLERGDVCVWFLAVRLRVAVGSFEHLPAASNAKRTHIKPYSRW